MTREVKELSQKVDSYEQERENDEKFDLLMTLLNLQKKDPGK